MDLSNISFTEKNKELKKEISRTGSTIPGCGSVECGSADYYIL